MMDGYFNNFCLSHGGANWLWQTKIPSSKWLDKSPKSSTSLFTSDVADALDNVSYTTRSATLYWSCDTQVQIRVQIHVHSIHVQVHFHLKDEWSGRHFETIRETQCIHDSAYVCNFKEKSGFCHWETSCHTVWLALNSVSNSVMCIFPMF